jgi:putative endonuclease
MRTYTVYIMSNLSKTLYIGVTSDLLRRVSEHKQKTIAGFTKTYNLTWLVYFEETNDVGVAIQREKQIKGCADRKSST